MSLLNRSWRRYTVELAITMTVYCMAVFVSTYLLNLSLPSLLRIPIALLPILPGCFVPVVVVRQLRRVDELQRQIQLEALGFAFASSGMLSFAYGWLQLAGFPQLSWLYVWPLMAMLWGVGTVWATWRYR